MSLGKTWYTLAQAEDKYGIGRTVLLEWVDEGVVRCEREKGEVARVNADDLELQSNELLRRAHKED